MRRARVAFEGSYHHIMNRGIEDIKIFFDEDARIYFLDSMKEKAKKLKMRIFAYCIMPNHFHIVVQNTGGKLSEFMKQLDGQYGIYYRKRTGGLGHVFQGRFKSTLIQEDVYMNMAIIYVLLNPVRAYIVDNPWKYRWSSIKDYFSGEDSSFVDTVFVEEMFNSREEMENLLNEWGEKKLPTKKTRVGEILGEDKFIKDAINKFDRRKEELTSRKMRLAENSFISSEDVIRKFEERNGMELRNINLNTHKGKRLRGELLVSLKDEAGLSYSQIIKMQSFQSLKYSSLGKLYERAKIKMEKGND